MTTLREELMHQRWSKEKVQAYIDQFGVIKACNYVPAYCYNYMQMWYDYREKTIKKEVAFAKDCDLNSFRIFLPLFAFQDGGKWDMVKKNLRHFMDLCRDMEISIMLSFQPNYMKVDKGEEEGPYVDFKPGRHMNHWYYPNADFDQMHKKTQVLDVVYSFMEDIMDEYYEDTNIVAWDLWNETWPEDRECLELIFSKAREINPMQPLTACWEAFDISDVISFHNYVRPGGRDRYGQKGSLDFMEELERALSFQRPVLCTECLARSEGNTFESFLPFFSKHRIGFYFWGLCAGAAQYHFPWDWPEGSPEPKEWFHCILYPDGLPYREEEIRLLKAFTYENGGGD